MSEQLTNDQLRAKNDRLRVALETTSGRLRVALHEVTAEQAKVAAEQDKVAAEQAKVAAEQAKVAAQRQLGRELRDALGKLYAELDTAEEARRRASDRISVEQAKVAAQRQLVNELRAELDGREGTPPPAYTQVPTEKKYTVADEEAPLLRAKNDRLRVALEATSGRLRVALHEVDAEQAKVAAEQDKVAAEQAKVAAEQAKVAAQRQLGRELRDALGKLYAELDTAEEARRRASDRISVEQAKVATERQLVNELRDERDAAIVERDEALEERAYLLRLKNKARAELAELREKWSKACAANVRLEAEIYRLSEKSD